MSFQKDSLTPSLSHSLSLKLTMFIFVLFSDIVRVQLIFNPTDGVVVWIKYNLLFKCKHTLNC